MKLLRLARKGPFELSHEILSLLGLSAEQAKPVIAALGYRMRETDDGPRLVRTKGIRRTEGAAAKGKSESRSPRQTPGKNQKSRQRPRDPNSPFAKLQDLRIAK